MDDRMAVIHQPDFLPYLGFFDRLLKADVYVVLDNVQFVHSNRNWTSRDRIKTAKGAKWITVSTKKAPRNTPICEILLDTNEAWRERNLNLIIDSYHKSPYFEEIMPYLIRLYDFSGTRFMDFSLESIKMLMQMFDIDIPIVVASTLAPKGHKNSLIVDIIKKIGCRRYLSGIGAKDYYEASPYEQEGIEVIWQDFKHPVYPQQFEGFIPYLSSIDLLLNCGIEKSRDIIRGKGDIQYL